MLKIRLLTSIVCLLTLLSLVRVGYSMDYVIIEFFDYKPCSCDADHYKIYKHNSQVADDLQEVYGSKVLVEKIPFFSEEGRKKREEYGIGSADWNAIVINHERAFLGYVNETYLR